MEAISASGTLLETAKVKAKEIAEAYRETDLFRLGTNDFEARHQRWVNKEEFLQLLDDVSISPDVRSISEVLSRQQESHATTSGQQKISYLISDFQQTMADFENIPRDSLMNVRLVPLEAAGSENLFIDSCWFVSPVHQLNQAVKLVVRIINDSDQAFEKVPLKLTVNGKQKALAGFDIGPGAIKDVELPFTNYEAGIQAATVEITDYPVVFDDRLFFVYHVAGTIPVLSINGKDESPYLNSLFGVDSAFSFVNNPVSNIDYNRLQQYELIILNGLEEISSGLAQELSGFIDNGGSLLVIPSAKTNTDNFRLFLSGIGSNYFTVLNNEATRVSAIDRENPVFDEVFETTGSKGKSFDNTDLPQVKGYYTITTEPGTSQVRVMTLLNGKPFLTMESAGKGQVFLLAVPADEAFSNFVRHALFVPAMFRIALLSAASDPLYYVIGQDSRIELSNTVLTGDNILKISSTTEEFEFIPGIQNLNRKVNLYIYNQVRKAGHYTLLSNDEVIKGLGFNFNRQESVMKFYKAPDIENKLGLYALPGFEILEDSGKPLSDAIKDMNQGTLLWKLFIILALVFLAIEVVLLRFWRSVK